jgi:hypothetical protein
MITEEITEILRNLTHKLALTKDDLPYKEFEKL